MVSGNHAVWMIGDPTKPRLNFKWKRPGRTGIDRSWQLTSRRLCFYRVGYIYIYIYNVPGIIFSLSLFLSSPLPTCLSLEESCRNVCVYEARMLAMISSQWNPRKWFGLGFIGCFRRNCIVRSRRTCLLYMYLCLVNSNPVFFMLPTKLERTTFSQYRDNADSTVLFIIEANSLVSLTNTWSTFASPGELDSCSMDKFQRSSRTFHLHFATLVYTQRGICKFFS